MHSQSSSPKPTKKPYIKPTLTVIGLNPKDELLVSPSSPGTGGGCVARRPFRKPELAASNHERIGASVG